MRTDHLDATRPEAAPFHPSYLSSSEMLMFDAPPTRDCFVPAPPPDPQSAPRSDDDTGLKRIALRLPFGDENGLDTIVADIAQQCSVPSLLVQWHPKGKPAQMLRCARLQPVGEQKLAACREHGVATAARVNAGPFAADKAQVFLGDAGFSVAIVLDDGIVTLTGEQRSLANSDPRWDRLERILPHTVAFFEQWRATHRVRAALHCLDRAVEFSGLATVLLGSNCEIVHANSAAEKILTQKDGLRRNRDTLACAAFPDTLRLQAAISHLQAEPGDAQGPDPVLAIERAGRRPLTLALTVAHPDGGSDTAEGCTIAYIIDPEQDLTSAIEPACSLYGLSHSETRLTCALAAGYPVGMAAKRAGVREQTARSYLKQIFVKTATNRQAELIQLMLTSAVRLVSGKHTQAYI